MDKFSTQGKNIAFPGLFMAQDGPVDWLRV
jgi:hypothetical protein